MKSNIVTVLKNTLKTLEEHREACQKDGYSALAADMTDRMNEISQLLVSNQWEEGLHNRDDRPKVAKGLDDKMYLVFQGSWDAGTFLNNLGISEYSVPLHHFGGYDNAILIDDEPKPKKVGFKSDDAVKEAEVWLRAISTWLLENDHDMTLPDGVLDTDPLDIADRLGEKARDLN